MIDLIAINFLVHTVFLRSSSFSVGKIVVYHLYFYRLPDFTFLHL